MLLQVMVIAAHTALVLGFRTKPNKNWITGITVFTWMLVIIFAVIGPAFVAKSGMHPFYGFAGGVRI